VLLVVAGDHLLDEIAGKLIALYLGETDQFVEVGPSLSIECQADGLRLMAQDKTQELAGRDEI
jgi:hypothetical protein